MTQLNDDSTYPIIAIRPHYYEMVGGLPVLLCTGTAFITVRLSDKKAIYPAFGEWRESGIHDQDSSPDGFTRLLEGCREAIVPQDVGLNLLLQHEHFNLLPTWVQELAVACST